MNNPEFYTIESFEHAIANYDINAVICCHIDAFTKSIPLDIVLDVIQGKYLYAGSYYDIDPLNSPKETVYLPQIGLTWFLINTELWKSYKCSFLDVDVMKLNVLDPRFMTGSVYQFGRKGTYLLTLYLHIIGAKCYFFRQDIAHPSKLGTFLRILEIPNTQFNDDFSWTEYMNSLGCFSVIYEQTFGKKLEIDHERVESARINYLKFHPTRT